MISSGSSSGIADEDREGVGVAACLLPEDGGIRGAAMVPAATCVFTRLGTL